MSVILNLEIIISKRPSTLNEAKATVVEVKLFLTNLKNGHSEYTEYLRRPDINDTRLVQYTP